MIRIHVALANMASEVRARFSRENGATAVEYGLLVALIAAVIVAVVAMLGQQVKGGFDTVSNCIASKGTATGC